MDSPIFELQELSVKGTFSELKFYIGLNNPLDLRKNYISVFAFL
jgi:hypothetical protein